MLVLQSRRTTSVLHRSPAYRIIYTVDNPFCAKIENTRYDNLFGVILRPQVPHNYSFNSGSVYIISIEPPSKLGQKLERIFFSNTEQKTITFTSQDKISSSFGLPGEFSTCEFLKHLNSFALENLPIKDEKLIDRRVAQALRLIEAQYMNRNFKIQHIADVVYLSPSRLCALFRQVAGCSLTRYILWVRLKAAIIQTFDNDRKKISMIALENGFYDSSNLNRYMYEMIGVSPLYLRKWFQMINPLLPQEQIQVAMSWQTNIVYLVSNQPTHFTKIVFDDHSFSFELLRAIGYAAYGGADISECLMTAYAIKEGDEESWYLNWLATAKRIHQIAIICSSQGKYLLSAREAFLRASNYYRVADFFKARSRWY